MKTFSLPLLIAAADRAAKVMADLAKADPDNAQLQANAAYSAAYARDVRNSGVEIDLMGESPDDRHDAACIEAAIEADAMFLGKR